MKIKKSGLVDALKVLGRVVSQTSPVKVQRSVRFLGVGELVWLTATDGVESVTVEVIGDAGDMEDFAVEYKALRELIRSTRGGEIEVTGKRLDWPETEAVPDDAVTVELPPDFGKLLAQAAPVVDLREARLALRGINLSRDGVTVTNGKELLNLPCPLKIPEDMTLPFPLALLTARPEGTGTLHLWRSRNERLFRIVIGGFLWQGKALPGNFPDWKQVIPADKTLDYQIEIHEPERVITFLKAVPDCPPFHAVELNVVPNGVTVIPNNFPDMELRLEATVIDAVTDVVKAHNWQILDEQYGLARDGQRMFGVMRINRTSSTEWSRCIGIRNSHDRTIAVGLAAGLTVRCCSNLMFGGSMVLKRRHTSRIELNGLVLEAVNALELEFLTLENVAEELKIDELNDDEVRASLVVAAERQAIPSCDILTVWKEFKHPRHEEFAEPTRWSLLNAFTETAKKYSPARADQCYRSLTRLFGLDGKPAELWKR